jgi:hypothetical protein
MKHLLLILFLTGCAPTIHTMHTEQTFEEAINESDDSSPVLVGVFGLTALFLTKAFTGEP